MANSPTYERLKTEIISLAGFDSTFTSPLLKLDDVRNISKIIDNTVGCGLTRREAGELRLANRANFNMLYQIINN